MKKIFPFLLSGLLIVISCSKSDDLLKTSSDLKSGKMVERTIKFVESTGTMDVVMNYDACPDFGLQMFIQGGGNASHIGKFTVVNTICLDTDLNPVSPIRGEITAANGDKIFTIVLQAPWMENEVIHYRYEILPELCTGRFEGATGFIIMWGDIDYTTMTWDLEGEGTIVY